MNSDQVAPYFAEGPIMSVCIRCAFATAILLLSLMPAWSKTERIVLRGNTFFFEIPDNLSSSPANGSGYDPIAKRPKDDLLLYEDTSFSSRDPTMLLFGYEPDRVDLRSYVVDAGPLERSNSVSIVRSTTGVEMAASTSSCGGNCFIVVKVSDPGGFERSQAEALFNSLVRALDTHSFDRSGVTDTSPGITNTSPSATQGPWLVEIIIASAVTFSMLRKSGSSRTHAVAFVSAAVLTGIAAFAIFEVANPYPGYSSGARFNATMESLGAWFVATVAGFVVGSVAAKLIRPKATTTLT